MSFIFIYVTHFCLLGVFLWSGINGSALKYLETSKGVPCQEIFKNYYLPCICSFDVENSSAINCNGITFLREFPILPHRQKIHSFSQSGSGLQSLEAQLFTASSIPLRMLDFSNNLLRRITERTFDGIEGTLKELNLQNNKLGDQLNSVFSSNEFHKLSSLEKLDLSRNEIKEFQSGIFSGLDNLQELVLEGNRITTIPRSAIHGLQSLISLHLQSNYILEIGVHSFPNLTKLQFLNLSSNDIIAVQSDALSALPSLKTLILTNNQIKFLGSSFLNGLQHLESLDISQNLLEDLVLDTTDLPIKKLVLHSNKIRTLRNILLNKFSSLEYLDVRRNRIFEISPNAFSSMKSLKELHLDTNAVRKVTNISFIGLDNLSDLTLNDNRILAFPTEALSSLKSLKKLNLDYNRIAAISREILAPIKLNKELSLAFNLISEIPDETFMEFQYLELLNLHGNKITDFSQRKTGGLENSLLFLDIGYNEITELPKLHFSNLLILSAAKNKISHIRAETLKSLTKLLYLNVSYNMVKDFSPDLFLPLTNMERLDLQHNLLKSVPMAAFQNLSILEINLKANQIQELQENTFVNLQRLKSLDLSLNKIGNIAGKSFSNTPNIEYLNLMENELTVFRGDEFSSKTKIKSLTLSRNKIAFLYSESFALHPRIRYLDLSFNVLTFFPYETINSLTDLIHINMEGNKLHTIGDGYLSNLPYLREIDLQNNLISKIGEYAFSNSSNLKTINLQNNSISSIAENTFNDLNHLELDLSSNNLSFLHGNIFSRAKGLKLEKIDLSRNKFSDFPNEALKKQYSFLEQVNISHNNIRQLPSNADVLVNVKELDVSYNPLSADAHHVLFSEPKSVRNLFVEGVGISNLPTIEYPFLKQLNLKGNKLSEMKANIFERATMLSNLDLSENHISDFNADLLPALSKLSYLQDVDISSNPIRVISQNAFSHFPHMRNLKIKNLQYLSQMSCDSFDDLPRLRRLHVYGFSPSLQINVKQCLQNLTGLEMLGIEIKDLLLKDQLQSIFSPKLDTLLITGSLLRAVSSSAFAGMLSPTIHLQLMDTSIAAFSDKLFLPLPLSSQIEFSVPHNKIEKLSHELLAVLDNKQINIIISGIELNPINCNCHINAFWSWLQDKMNSSFNRHFGLTSLLDVTCHEPATLKGKRIKDIKLSMLVCDSSTSTKVSATMEEMSTFQMPAMEREITTQRDLPFIIFEPPVTKKPSVPLSSIPATSNRSTLTKVDTMIIGIVAGVVAFVCILIIIICIIRLRRAHPLYTAGPLAGPLAFRAEGKCTCLKPPTNSCTCYPMYPMPYSGNGRPMLPLNSQQKMLPLPPPPPSAFMNSIGQSRRLRNTPYYVTYPESDTENK
ncbi:protein artichoke-like [Uloborus diversus]|uniref:protein artichoke-like n=1 Tax=Uloborus diversus TaxID=327109 RepID=UPI0024091CFE|nr:protein artichoke-like [Uloborus diversus]